MAYEMVARETGLEPATFGVTGRRSNQLSYSRISAGRSPLNAGVRVAADPGQVKRRAPSFLWEVSGACFLPGTGEANCPFAPDAGTEPRRSCRLPGR
jgi:hypothetical protein